MIVHRAENIEDNDKKYGLPSLKKFPMPDAEHVRSAIKFFNYTSSPEQEEELAKAILGRMKEYGLTFDDFTVGEENRFSKYIPKKELAHHGIEGQKWGQMNGPPYPLDYGDHSALELRSNPKSELNNYVNGSINKAKNFVREHKVGLVLGGIAVTAMLMNKAEKYLRKGYIEDITPYWKNQIGEVDSGQKYVKRMEKDLKKMKFSDLASEARFVKKNDWSRLSFDGKHWR